MCTGHVTMVSKASHALVTLAIRGGYVTRVSICMVDNHMTKIDYFVLALRQPVSKMGLSCSDRKLMK